MADILIRGMEMPKEGNWKTIRIYPDGTCAVPYWSGDCKVLDCTAIPLPEGHGRLMAEWISVNDRLPDEMKDKTPLSGWSESVRPSEDVLIWLKHEKRQAVAWFSHECDYWTSADEKTDYLQREVSHWMPLPEPPKEVNDGN